MIHKYSACIWVLGTSVSTPQTMFLSPPPPQPPRIRSLVRSKSQCLSRRGPAVVPPDTCLIPPWIRGGLTMSNNDVILIDSWNKIDLIIFYHIHVCKCQQRRSACTNVQSDYRHLWCLLILVFTFMLGFDAIRVSFSFLFFFFFFFFVLFLYVCYTVKLLNCGTPDSLL